jgi:MFS family permease
MARTESNGPDVEKMTPVMAETAEDSTKTVTIDTLHGDEAAKVINNYSGDPTWTEKEEKRLVRKVDMRLITILTITGALQFYDKGLLSSALCGCFAFRTAKYLCSHLTNIKALFGLLPELQLNQGVRYSFSSSIFYLGYLSGSYPATVLAQRFPIERVFFGIVILWGACVMCTVACTNWQGLFAQRFFLGFLEAGVSPCSMVIIGQWYKKSEQSIRIG